MCVRPQAEREQAHGANAHKSGGGVGLAFEVECDDDHRRDPDSYIDIFRA